MAEIERTVRQEDELDGFTYVVSEPPAPNSTIFLLHGTGGDERDLLDLGAFVAPEARLVGARGRAPERGMNRWFARHAEGVLDVEDIRRRATELAAFLPRMQEHHRIDAGEMWALGFSNGANMAAAMLLRYPHVFAGAILMRPMLPILPEQAPDLAGIPVLVMAGINDTMIPGDSTRELITLLEKSGADLTVNWADAGHRFGMDEVEQVREWYAGHAGA